MTPQSPFDHVAELYDAILGVKHAIKGLLPAAGSAYEEAVGSVPADLSGIGSARLLGPVAKPSR